MIGGEQRGPYELSELTAAGVTPDTYVWCKGMDDWTQAGEVADICRYHRLRIAELMHPSVQPPQAAQSQQWGADADPYADVPPRFRYLARKAGVDPSAFAPESVNTSEAPVSTILLAFLVTIFCFPITGAVSVYYSIVARKAWEDATRSEGKSGRPLYTDAQRSELRLKAHEATTKAKMWIGISFFVGLIFYSFLLHRF